MGWYIVGFIDTVVKAFEYGYFILIPIILIIIFLLIKKKNLKRFPNSDLSKLDKLSKIINLLMISIVLIILTSRMWGPTLYGSITDFSISRKELEIEEKLEKKYHRNFTFVSKDEININPDAGDVLGQDIDSDYSIMYRFKDDDGVIAIVQYKKNYASDYYESKRSKYEIEKKIKDYANQVNFPNKFYVFIESSYESLNNSGLDDNASDNFIKAKRNSDNIHFILMNKSEENKNFIISALKPIFGTENYVGIYEHIVTEDEYNRAITFYESSIFKNEIEEPYENFKFNFDKTKELYSQFYYVR